MQFLCRWHGEDMQRWKFSGTRVAQKITLCNTDWEHRLLHSTTFNLREPSHHTCKWTPCKLRLVHSHRGSPGRRGPKGWSGAQKCFLCRTIRNMWTNITINTIALNNSLNFASVFVKHYSRCLRWIIVKVNILTRSPNKIIWDHSLLGSPLPPLVTTVCYFGEMRHNKAQPPTAWSLSAVTDRIQNVLPTNV